MARLQDIQREYEAFLAYSETDVQTVTGLLWSLKKKGLKITHHTDPEGPFLPGSSAYENMANAIEKSDKTLVYMTKAALDSGFVCLEIMLALEKTQRTGQICIYLIAENLSEDAIHNLKHGLLRAIPHISVNMNRENWEEQLISKLKEEGRTLSNILPVGNLSHGQVFSHYCGYLQHILPVLEAEIKKCPLYQNNSGIMCLKYFMLIPFSCNTEIPLEGVDRKTGIRIEHVDSLKIVVTYAGKPRDYVPTIYKATKGQQSIYFIGEFPKVLYSVFQIKARDIADVDTRLEAIRFYHTMNNLLNHRNNPNCNDKCVLLRYADDQFSCAEVLWAELSEELKRTARKHSGSGDIATVLSNLRFTDDYQTKYVASISCLSDSQTDRDEACRIAAFLESKNKSVITRGFMAGHLDELSTANWNILIISEETFKSDILNIELVSAIYRSAAEKHIQVLPIVTGMKMDQVPTALKWVTMLSTEQRDYKEIILQHIEGQVVHMQEKMPAGDVSTGLGWAYLLNYLNLQLGGKTEEDHDFRGRILSLLEEAKMQCGCLPRFYVILPSTGGSVDQKDGPITYVGKSQPIVQKDQAGTKDRNYFMHMYKYTFPDKRQEVCYMSELCTPGCALNNMAKQLPFAGIEQGENLTKQIHNLGDVIDGRLREQHYKESIGDFTELFCLIRYDMEKGEALSDVIRRQIESDLKQYSLIYAGHEPME